MWALFDRRGRVSGLLRAADFVVTQALAVTLVIAATAKLGSGKNPADGILPLEVVVAAEAVAAFLLVFSRGKTLSRLIVVGFFLVLAAFSLAATIRGRPSCDCFGEISVPPLWLVFVDLFAGAWLLVSGASMWLDAIGSKPIATSPPPCFGRGRDLPWREWFCLSPWRLVHLG